MVPRSERSAGTRGSHIGACLHFSVSINGIKDTLQGRPGYSTMRDIIAKLIKLIEDYVFSIFSHYVAGVVDFLDVAFSAIGSHNVTLVGYPIFQPLEPFPAHAFRQNSYAATPQNARNSDAAPAVIPR